MHQREAIRVSVVAQLIGKTAAGSRVFDSRVEDLQDTELPGINVFTSSEQTEDDSKNVRPYELWRDLSLEILLEAAHSEAYPVARALDDLAKEVEAAIDADPYFSRTCGLTGAFLLGTELTIRRDADPIVGFLLLTYTVPYTTVPAPAAAVDDFARAGVTTQIDGAAANNTVADLVAIPTT